MTVEARIREILANVVEIEVESEDDDIFETGRLDSLGLVELIFAIEEQLGVAIALDQLDVEEFTNVRSIVALVAAAEEHSPVAPLALSADEADVRCTGETESASCHRARPRPDASRSHPPLSVQVRQEGVAAQHGIHDALVARVDEHPAGLA